MQFQPTNVAVFWDLENCRIIPDEGYREDTTSLPKAKAIAGALRQIIRQQKLIAVPSLLRAYASMYRFAARKKLPELRQADSFQKALAEHGFSLTLVQGKADDGLINDIESHFIRESKASLPRIVILVTGDPDFIPVIRQLNRRSKITIVIGGANSRKCIRDAACQFIELETLLCQVARP